MTHVNNIQASTAQGAHNAKQTNQLDTDQADIAGFIALLLGQIQELPEGQEVPAGDADLQALAEKIADDPNWGGDNRDKTLSLINDLLGDEGLEALPPVLHNALTRDLTTSLATAAQSADLKAPDTLKATDLQAPSLQAADLKIAAAAHTDLAGESIDLKAMANILSDIEPGAAQTGAQTATTHGKAAPIFTETAQQSALEKFTADITLLLEQQGLSKEEITAQLNALNGSKKPEAALPATLQTSAAADTAPELANLIGKTDQEAKELLLKARDAQVADNSKRDTHLKPDAPAPVTAPPAPAAKPAPAISSIAMVNALAQAGENIFGSHDGSQSSFNQGNSPMPAEGFAYAKAAGAETASQSFGSHLTTGRSMPAQTMHMLAVQVQRNAAAKIDTFSMQLEPANLGRLDIRMRFGKDGEIKMHMTAENADTLSMLQKDTQQLERILQQAGLNADKDSLSFDLRQHSEGSAEGQHDDHNDTRANTSAALDTAEDELLQANIAIAAARTIGNTGVNITV